MVKNIAVIGLGRFGQAVVNDLIHEGYKNIFVVDNNKNIFNDYVSANEGIITGKSFDAKQKKFLNDSGLNTMDIVVIAISDLQSSIIISLNLLDLKAKKIIVKAVNKNHKRILESIGIKEIIQTELLAAKLIKKIIKIETNFNFQIIDDEFISFKIKIKNINIDSKTLKDLNFFNSLNCHVSYIKRNKNIIICSEDSEVKLNDELYFIAKIDMLKNIINKVQNN